MRRIFTVVLLFSISVSPLWADPEPPSADSVAYQFVDASEMTVYGSSNVRDWTMDVQTIDGRAVLDSTAKARPAIRSVRVEVPVRAIVADRSSMQEKAHKALKKSEHPIVTFAASDVAVAEAASDSFAVTATGDLTIAGETRTAEVTANGVQQKDGSLTLAGEYALKLSTFDVERPSALFGALTVDDEIRLGFDVVLRPAPRTTEASSQTE
jgi:polyisoprenoid-binding protein YceI